ncbi:unnamed protein product [Caenorhabditis bovis]|uniref:GRIP domain-containing protein n=1 Tax=Caenorhabditis bovis TaxID=2654633 RepID=A0A8S1EBB1_9PELO|nr:unnamed protein product [Caenorhabditis bovis]
MGSKQTEAHSSFESFASSKRDENYKSPESSDWEGYATPLASSRPDLHILPAISIETTENEDGKPAEQVELTPIGTPRRDAESPMMVTSVQLLKNAKFIQMTQLEKGNDSEIEYDENEVEIEVPRTADSLEFLNKIAKFPASQNETDNNVHEECFPEIEIKTEVEQSELLIIEVKHNENTDKVLEQDKVMETHEFSFKGATEVNESSHIGLNIIEPPVQVAANFTLSALPAIIEDKETIAYDADTEEVLTVQKISDDVQQLVDAINAIEPDDPVELSATVVNTGNTVTIREIQKRVVEMATIVEDGENIEEKTMQQKEQNTSQIWIDPNIIDEMDNLKMENEQLRSQIEAIDLNSIDNLYKEYTNVQKQLAEANHTIDEIEIEAEQQYTEMTAEIDELCELVMKKDEELAKLKEKIATAMSHENQLKDDVDSQRAIVHRQKEIIESLREELDNMTLKYVEMTKLRDKAAEEATLNKMKNEERERFLAKEAQMSLEMEDLQRELNKQKMILSNTSMAKMIDSFERKILKLENDVRERDIIICKQNQSARDQVNPVNRITPHYLVLGELPSAGSSSESFQNGLDHNAKEAIFSYLISDRHSQLANIYSIGRILELNNAEERTLEKHLTKDRFN